MADAWPPPPTMDALPRHGGRPVPHVVAWSSEGRMVIRRDPLLNPAGDAVFARGRQGRGRPVWGALSWERQRRAVLLARCQVCDAPLEDGTGWLPTFEGLTHLIPFPTRPGAKPVPHAVAEEPPACQPCALWAAVMCPGVRRLHNGRRTVIQVLTKRDVVQLVDPGHHQLRGADRFDQVDDADRLAVLSRQAMRRVNDGAGPGVVGHVRYAVLTFNEFEVPNECPWSTRALVRDAVLDLQAQRDYAAELAMGFGPGQLDRIALAARSLPAPHPSTREANPG